MKKLFSLLLVLAVLLTVPVAASAAESDGYWVKMNGAWYYYEDGVMAIGWVCVNNTWYYMNGNGVMQTGWQKISGSWYYFAQNGAMQTGWQTIGGSRYYFEPTGAMRTGWLAFNGRWYYLNPTGAMAVGWTKVGGNWYYFGSTGLMQTGWQKIGSSWYYFDGNGAMLTGHQTIGGKRYYFTSGGAMVTGWQKAGENWYYYGTDGSMQTGWEAIGGKWYYFNDDGTMYTGWMRTQYLQGYWGYGYYLHPNGAMATGWNKIDGAWYYFDGNGMQQVGWEKVNGKWYYLTAHGGMVTGWLNPGSGEWHALGCPDDRSYNDSYYFDANGVMVTGTHIIDGKRYTFAPSGILQDYEFFLEYNCYRSEWEGWQDPESYAEIDIDKDGSKELIILSETDYGFFCYEVYGFSKSNGSIVKLGFSDDFANPGTFYIIMDYSSKYKALAIRELNNGSMFDFQTYATRSGDSLVVIGSIGYERFNGQVTYSSSLDGKNKTISKSEYMALIEEQRSISYSYLP